MRPRAHRETSTTAAVLMKSAFFGKEHLRPNWRGEREGLALTAFQALCDDRLAKHITIATLELISSENFATIGATTKMHPSHKWELFEGRWIISFAYPGTVLDGDWDDFIRALERSDKLEFTIGVSLGTVNINSVQRKKAADFLKKRGALAVVVTDDRLTRGIATAVSWFGVNVKAFAWNDVDGALAAVKAPPGVEERMKKSILAFRDEVQQMSGKS